MTPSEACDKASEPCDSTGTGTSRPTPFRARPAGGVTGKPTHVRTLKDGSKIVRVEWASGIVSWVPEKRLTMGKP